MDRIALIFIEILLKVKKKQETSVGNKNNKHQEASMKSFLEKYNNKIIGYLSGFDRIILKGTFKNLSYKEGMLSFLLNQKILLKDFGNYAERMSNELKNKSYLYVKQKNRPIEYLASSKIRKNEYTKNIAKKDKMIIFKNGKILFICVLYN